MINDGRLSKCNAFVVGIWLVSINNKVLSLCKKVMKKRIMQLPLALGPYYAEYLKSLGHIR